MNRIVPVLVIAAAAALSSLASTGAEARTHRHAYAFAGAYGSVAPGPGAYAPGRRTAPRQQPRGSHWHYNNSLNTDFQMGGDQ
jgi:hypothetical protein